MNEYDYFYTNLIGNIYFSYLIGFQEGQSMKDADAREKAKEFLSLYAKSPENIMMTSEETNLKDCYKEDLEFLKKHIKQTKY